MPREPRGRDAGKPHIASGDPTRSKVLRVTEREGLKGFDTTVYPGDYGRRCEKEPKCLKPVGHEGKCYPNGRFGEASA